MRKFDGFQKGINLGGWLSQCDEYIKEHFDIFIREEDIRQIADWGFDHIRLPLDYETIMEENGTFKETGFTYIDNCINWCRKYGLHMVLDLHKTKGYYMDLMMNTEAHAFFSDEELTDTYLTIWNTLSMRYGKYHEMLAFELLNEVVNPANAQLWNVLADRAVKVIRPNAPDTYIIIGGVAYNHAETVALLDAPADDKIVYNFHCYEPNLFTHQAAHWVMDMPKDFSIAYPAPLTEYQIKSRENKQPLLPDYVSEISSVLFEELFAGAIKKAEENNAILYCGEYGVIDQAAPEDTLRWFKDIHSVFKKYGIGHAIWNYRAMDFSFVDAHYDDVREEIIKDA